MALVSIRKKTASLKMNIKVHLATQKMLGQLWSERLTAFYYKVAMPILKNMQITLPCPELHKYCSLQWWVMEHCLISFTVPGSGHISCPLSQIIIQATEYSKKNSRISDLKCAFWKGTCQVCRFTEAAAAYKGKITKRVTWLEGMVLWGSEGHGPTKGILEAGPKPQQLSSYWNDLPDEVRETSTLLIILQNAQQGDLEEGIFGKGSRTAALQNSPGGYRHNRTGS